MRVSDLTRSKPVEVVVDLGDGDTVTLVFDRNRITPAWVASMQAHSESDALALSGGLAETILSWDVTEDDGQPFPPSRENLGRLSYGTQKQLTVRLMGAAIPSDAEGKDLSAQPPMQSSDSADPQPTSPNGQATSPLPVP